VRVAVLWHLHQPDYRDPDSGVPVMPWARLHGLRGYRDLLVEALEHGTPWTINLVPSLLDQLLHYAEGGSDPHLELTRRPADGLSEAEAAVVAETFVAGHPTLRRPFRDLEEVVRSGRRLSVAELRDLQVWSTLAWFGATALRDHPSLRALRRKRRGFSEADKAEVLGVQRQVLRELPSLWRLVAESPEGTAFSLSAYDHPILPLLVDARHAKRSLPGLEDVDFAWPDDARAQLSRARRRAEELLGRVPQGLWPSEGAVSPEVVEIAAEEGFRWLCSDQGVLHRSDRRGGGVPGGWDLGHGVRGFFRDTDLSDRIGFRYAERDAEEAAADFIAGVAQRSEGGLVVVALDGENPWETFSDAGGAFRAALREGLDEGVVRPVRLDDEREERPVGTVTRIHTGSWIGADLAIWIGHEEDRRAWRELGRLRDAVAEAPDDDAQAALPHVHAAEGSDWFWWYGDDFHTPFAGRFDQLFRAHLRAAWRALGRAAPASLDQPLLEPSAVSVQPPARWLSRPIDPTWPTRVGCGRIGIPQGAMARGRPPELLYGFGRRAGETILWLRLEGRGHRLFVGGEDQGLALPNLDVAVPVDGRPEVELSVVGPEGPAWPSPAVLPVPAAHELWATP